MAIVSLLLGMLVGYMQTLSESESESEVDDGCMRFDFDEGATDGVRVGSSLTAGGSGTDGSGSVSDREDSEEREDSSLPSVSP